MGFWRFDWWRDENNRDGASSLVGILKVVIPAGMVVVVAVAGWFGFKPDGGSDSQPSIQVGDNSQVNTGDGTLIVQGDQSSVVIGMTIEQHEAILTRRQAELRADLDRASDAEKALIQQQLDAVQSEMTDLEASYQAALEDLRKLREELAELSGTVPQDQLDAALKALTEGDRSRADALLADVEAQAADAVKLAAKAAFMRGEIADQEIRWGDAADHFQRAARLDPTYDHLLEAGVFLYLDGRYDAALRIEEELVSVAKRDFGDEDARTATAINNLADSMLALGDYARAEELFRDVLEIDRATIGTGHANYAIHLNNLAGAIDAQGRYAEAEAMLRQSLGVTEQAVGQNHPDYAITLNNLAGAVEAQGRLTEAEALYREAIDVDLKTVGKGHPQHTAHKNNLASVLRGQGRLDEAEVLFRQALESSKATIGDDHPNYAIQLSNLAGVLKQLEQYDEAETLFRQALEIDKATVGESHINYAIRLNNLGGTVAAQGRHDEAEALMREALGVFEAVLPADHPNLQIMRDNLDRVMREKNSGSQAAPEQPAE